MGYISDATRAHAPTVFPPPLINKDLFPTLLNIKVSAARVYHILFVDTTAMTGNSDSQSYSRLKETEFQPITVKMNQYHQEFFD